jgi:hypothetical protein
MRWLLALATLVSGTALLAGCSSSSEDEPEAPPPATEVPGTFFGVVPQAALTGDDLDRMGEGKVGTLRLVVTWAAIDPTAEPDDLNFSIIDPIVLGAARNGIEVLPTLFGTPDWVASDLDGEDCAPNCAIFAPHSPQALDAWAEFAGAAVDRYGPGGSLWAENPDVHPIPMRSWQIWNEQNSPTFYQPNPDVAGYESLLEAAAGAIHDRDPEATIILGGMFGAPPDQTAYTAWGFLRKLYEIPGAEAAFEGVAAHPYAAHLGKIKSQIELIRREMSRAGDTEASLWVTEIGWASSGPADPLNRGPEGQAERLTEAFDFLLAKRAAWNVKSLIWYSWRDASGPGLCSWCGGSGLFTEAFEAKPSWHAFVSYTGGR